MVSPTLIDLNPVELDYFAFMISLNKWSGSCNAVDDIFTKICFLNKNDSVNVTLFNMITKLNAAKTLVNVKCDCKCKLNSRIWNSNQKWKNETCLCECKTYPTRKKDYSWNPKICISENGK